MKKLIIFVVLAALCVGGYVFYRFRSGGEDADVTYYRTQPVSRGDVTQEVSATGTVQPIKQVNVTTQVTGKVIELRADFNSRVKEGEVIALIDPDTYKSALASARAQLKSSQAALMRTKAQLAFAQKELDRQKKLAEKDMTTMSDLEAAQASCDELSATIMSNEAAIEQAQASVKTAETNLSYCTITAPVSGVVIDRSVDEGETVVSSMSASALFVIAADLTKIKVEAAIPEADVGGIRVGQRVNFTVDAYRQQFVGKVSEIRLSATTNSNVVTYPVIVEAENPGEKLFPGMTASIAVIVAEARDKVIVPCAALRFDPNAASGNINRRSTSADGVEVIYIADSETAIRAVEVKLGISDGVSQAIEDTMGNQLEGAEVAVGILSLSARERLKAAEEQQTRNPFMPTPPPRNRRGGQSRPAR